MFYRDPDLDQPGEAGHDQHGRIVLGMNTEVGRGECGHVLVGSVGDGGVRDGDWLGLEIKQSHLGSTRRKTGITLVWLSMLEEAIETVVVWVVTG